MNIPVINTALTGENIKKIAKEKGYSAEKLKETLGMGDKSNIYKWFRGDILPSIDNLLALSILFETGINDLIITEKAV